MTIAISSPKDLAVRFHDIREQTIDICQHLTAEDWSAQPAAFVSPPKWHLGHTTWFFENFVLREYLSDYSLFREDFLYCFNSYYQSQGDRLGRDHRGSLIRPPIEEVFAYRRYVNQALLGGLESGEIPEDGRAVIEVGLQHEQQHQELLVTDIKYIFAQNPLLPAVLPGKLPEDTRKAIAWDWHSIPEGVYEIGYEGTAFSWDNERSRHRVFLEPFKIANRLVTQAEYLEFMQDGGYTDFSHWLDDGWSWVQESRQCAPLYWFKKEGIWWQYTHHGPRPVDRERPVTHINYYEADAYARWKGCRLPTEQEWEVAYRLKGAYPQESGSFLENHNWFPAVEDKENPAWLGNCWEWTGSAYLPYPNYPRFKGALGEYNGKFMVNQMVLRGGSCATPRSHIRPTYRNFFYPNERWQFTGIRLAK